MSIKENGFFCYEQFPVNQEQILRYTPANDEWTNNPKIGLGPNHGLLHAIECVTWGQLLIPIVQERGLPIKPKVVLLALGRHDIGRKSDNKDPGHSIRAAASLDLRQASLMNEYELSKTDFEFVRKLILHHSQKYDPTKTEPDETLLLRLIDRLTMIGRYQETPWTPHDSIDFITEVTPRNLHGNSIITRKEIERMVNFEINLHRELKERKAKTTEDYPTIYLALAKEKGLIV